MYSRPEGSAAPTAGLHFTEPLADLHARGIGLETVTLHVGLDTFRPVESERSKIYVIHTEWASLSSAGAAHQRDDAGGRPHCGAGTTSVRTERAATCFRALTRMMTRPVRGSAGRFYHNVDLFIYPG
ncbi:MAG: S-adenosylmethionine:tRNA ribosyltransferase-isomerase [Caldilineaceae bacterium]